MGGDIIAEKFALLKTRGSNGVSFTYFTEDTVLGCKAVVKVSEGLEGLGLEYLKAINMARELEVPGLLLPFEGGILEEEGGFYLAFPELGEPSLENYLRMGAPLSCRDILLIGDGILHILEELHRASFCHLFIGTRNVFYRPRGEVTLKDAALRPEFFHSFLELINAPDFSYFSPEVMDGGSPGSKADLYAVGRLIDRLLSQATDAAEAGEEEALRWLARRCLAAGSCEETVSAEQVVDELEETISSARKAVVTGRIACNMAEQVATDEAVHGRGAVRRRRLVGGFILAAALVLTVLCGMAAAYFAAAGGESTPALGRGGGSLAGESISNQGLQEARDISGSTQAAPGSSEAAKLTEAPAPDNAGLEAVPGGRPDDVAREPEASGQPGVIPAADPSPMLPIASFNLVPGDGQSPLQVFFDASASYDPDGSIVSFAWSFGGSGRCLYHVFESNVIPAVIPVTLTVTDDGGHSAKVTHCVTLY